MKERHGDNMACMAMAVLSTVFEWDAWAKALLKCGELR